jgi:hypothetical protein
MVIFFEERDLLSFGLFMVSDFRKVAYTNSMKETPALVPQVLSGCGQDDLELWMYYKQNVQNDQEDA